MPKTYYLGQTKSGAYVGRGSKNDYGYTHAAVRNPDLFKAGAVVPLSACSFSRTAAGALTNALTYYRPGTPAEVVPVQIVDRAAYKAAMGKA